MSLLKKRKRVVGMRSLVTAMEALTEAVRALQYATLPRCHESVQALERAEAALGLRKDA